MICPPMSFFFFFFNDTATTEIYPLPLHDALPIWQPARRDDGQVQIEPGWRRRRQAVPGRHPDRKSTRLNSSHLVISYAVFCLKKKNLSLDLTSARFATCWLCSHRTITASSRLFLC